jgi:hypothetical protein
MGRKPIGSEAMVPAERKRRQRARERPFDAETEAEAMVASLWRRYFDENAPNGYRQIAAHLTALIGELRRHRDRMRERAIAED